MTSVRRITLVITLLLAGGFVWAADEKSGAAPPTEENLLEPDNSWYELDDEDEGESGGGGGEVFINLDEAVITIPVEADVSADEAIESMKLRANVLNVKFVAQNSLSTEYKALGLPNIRRTEILQFCDASIAKKLLEFDINFLAYMPCRIGLVEDNNGKLWIVTMNLNIFVTAADIPENLRKLAMKVRDDLENIMEAGAQGDL